MSLLEADEVVDDWRALTPLASGRDTELWLVKREGHAEPHVLAVLRPRAAADRTTRERFEWRSTDPAAAALAPAVVAHGEWDELPYRVTEYVHGCNLEQLLAGLARQGERLVPALAIGIVLAIAEAVDDARRAGAAHGAIRPRHVLLSADGEVRVIGFCGPHLSVDGSRYAAPELAPPQAASSTADVYALGLLTWELLTMRRAVFEGEALASARRFADDVSEEVAEVVARATARDPERRPGRPAALAEDLSHALGPDAARGREDVARVVARTMSDRLAELEAALRARASGVPTAVAKPVSEEANLLTRPTAAMDFAAALPTPDRARVTTAGRAPKGGPVPSRGRGGPSARAKGLLLLALLAGGLILVGFWVARALLGP